MYDNFDNDNKSSGVNNSANDSLPPQPPVTQTPPPVPQSPYGYPPQSTYGGSQQQQPPYNGRPQPQYYNGQPPYASAPPPPPPYQQPFYGVPQQPYRQYPVYPKPKSTVPLPLKIFLFVISFLAVGTVAGFLIFTVFTASVNTHAPEIDFGDYFSYEEQAPQETPEGEESTPPDFDKSNDENQLVLPDIKVAPNKDGITISGKPKGAELTAQQIYDKVVVSTVTVSAKIPLADGTYTDSVATGMFITSDGFMITNSHVVGNTKASYVTVTTHDGTEYPAVVVGFDKTTDLAVLKTDDHGFTPVEFGSADELNIGEWVIAIGNPGGSSFSGSLTRGVISGLNRNVGAYSANGMTYIQTDAAINPGNSGGPLVNMYGQVVGINSSKIVAQYYEGMGFAIPASKAKSIIDELLSTGYVNGRTRLGITGQNVLYGNPKGVIIVAIDEGESSFKGTNAQSEDVITAVDGKEVNGLSALANQLLSYKPGDTAEVTLYRPSTDEELTVTITLLEDKGETQR